MIINWYSSNIDLNNLSRRLRTGYALWLAESERDRQPSLNQMQSSSYFADLAPYVLTMENQGDAEAPAYVLLSAGPKVTQLFGRELAARRVEEVFEETGQSLISEVLQELRTARKPVYCRVTGSPVVAKDVEVIVIPLQHDDAAKELVLAVYDY
jgi:hypothetical protein